MTKVNLQKFKTKLTYVLQWNLIGPGHLISWKGRKLMKCRQSILVHTNGRVLQTFKIRKNHEGQKKMLNFSKPTIFSIFFTQTLCRFVVADSPPFMILWGSGSSSTNERRNPDPQQNLRRSGSLEPPARHLDSFRHQTRPPGIYVSLTLCLLCSQSHGVSMLYN